MEYKILSDNLTPSFLHDLSSDDRDRLAEELRDKILNTVSTNGGHLASNMGAVELTIALLSVFDYSKDQIIFDVGHQSYSYKLLTGRFSQFNTLRQHGGISGFPRRSESPYDVFDTGHSSTSISAAVGLARARDLNGSNNYIVSIIGDGAMTGGMAYEALNDLGNAKTPMVIILNDNEMSIDKNVGGLSKYLSNLRMSGGYISAKQNTEHFLLEKLPILSKPLIKIILAFKSFMRFIVNKRRKQTSFFEDLGLLYYGPIDGHDINGLIKALNAVKDIKAPVLLHIVTKKGKGYKHAEEMPSNYHGVGPFNIDEGVKSSKGLSYTSAFGGALCEIASNNKKVVAITAAMASGTGLENFSVKYPDRFFDCGIAEQHAVTMAAGMSVNGLIPVVAIYSSFLQRAYDQIIHDVCYMNNHVVFAIDRAGFVGADGHTHNGINDLAYLNSMPNIEILSPRDYSDLKYCLDYAINVCRGPVAIRYPRGGSSYGSVGLYDSIDDVKKLHLISSADKKLDFTIISTGKIAAECEEAISILSSEGIHGNHYNLTFVKPLSIDMFMNSSLSNNIFFVEEGIANGGIGEALDRLFDSNNMTRVHTIAIDNENSIIRAGSVNQQFNETGLDAEGIVSKIKSII